MKKLKLEKRRSYGHERIYPACETSKLLAELRGKPCFDTAAIGVLNRLGYILNIKDVA